MRVIIVAEHASTRFGGEAFLPFHYFRLLRLRSIDTRLVVHARTEQELKEHFHEDIDRLHFVDDSTIQKLLSHLGGKLPRRLAEGTTGFLSHLLTQFSQRRMVRELVRIHSIDVVHEPIPVSPKLPSLMWNVGAAVVIGPLNGGMEYPEAFQRQQGLLVRSGVALGRYLAGAVNLLLPGKLRADVVLVANRRTRDALPNRVRGVIADLVENGVSLSVWRSKTSESRHDGPVRFAFTGRLVDWKALDVVLEAMASLECSVPVCLEVIGDGPMRQKWEELADYLSLGSHVQFRGWMSQEDCAQRLREADVFVLPSLFECGGAVVLEAMAVGLPVLATAWGGPVDYLDSSCGILVYPDSPESLIRGFREGMKTLAESRELRERLGKAARERAQRLFDWDRKIDQILCIYALAAKREFDKRGASSATVYEQERDHS